LVCTDLASRGLDTSRTHHVINYDFPLNMSDYLHRAGRVGRVGSPQGAKVTNLVNGRIQVIRSFLYGILLMPNQVHLVQELEKAVRTNSEIPNVNANVIRIIRHRLTRNEISQMEREIHEDNVKEYLK